MDESIVEFVKSVKIESCRVSNTPHLIFLCGGIIADSESSPIRSARDYFYRHLKSHAPDFFGRVKLAEEINRWFDQDTFADLLELEVYLADLSDLTILFVESAGSIAELGAFATEDVLRPRTFAILNSSYDDTGTFIADGPVRRIKKHDKKLVRYYEWNDEDITDPSNAEIFEDISKDLIRYVRKRSKKIPKEQKLDNSHGHEMFLISDLIEIIGITTDKEIIECLQEWGYTVDKKKLNKYLSLLKHLKLIKRKLDADQTYWVSVTPLALIRFDFIAGAKDRDRDRIKLNIRKALSENDERRMKVYRRELLRRSGPRRRHV
jgi:hypothetical protein